MFRHSCSAAKRKGAHGISINSFWANQSAPYRQFLSVFQEAWQYEPSHGMTEEVHNFCKFLYSQVQSKDEEISRLTANIKQLTDEVRLSRLQQQVYNNENKALGVLILKSWMLCFSNYKKPNKSLPVRREGWKLLRPCWLILTREIISWKLSERRMLRNARPWRMK